MSEVNVTQKMQESLSRLHELNSFPFRSVLNPEYTRDDIVLAQTPAMVLAGLLRAREAREYAVSYRDFKVGAAIVALNYTPSSMRTFVGANIKPDEHSSLNVHAEQAALQHLRDRQYDAASMVFVVGETQPDTQSGHETHTLHPCGLCRGVMLEDELVDVKESLIISALPDFSKIELYTLEALHAFHTTKDGSGIQQFEFPHLTMFDPAPVGIPYIKLEDTDETKQEEEVWGNTIGAYLLNRRFDIQNDAA